MHAARQDLEVLLPAIGLTRPVFDTQIAAALIGLPAQVGYAELVQRLLGQELAKSHTRTDWSRRPLSPEQLEYALDDVRYLLPLPTRCARELERLGRLALARRGAGGARRHARAGRRPGQRLAAAEGPARPRSGRERLARALAAWRERTRCRTRPPAQLDSRRRRAARRWCCRCRASLAALAQIEAMPAGWSSAAARSCSSWYSAAQVPEPAPPLPGRRTTRPVKAALVKKLGAAVPVGGAGAASSCRRCWRRGATWSSSPTGTATARCCAAGAAPFSASGCWRRCELAARALAARVRRARAPARGGLARRARVAGGAWGSPAWRACASPRRPFSCRGLRARLAAPRRAPAARLGVRSAGSAQHLLQARGDLVHVGLGVDHAAAARARGSSRSAAGSARRRPRAARRTVASLSSGRWIRCAARRLGHTARRALGGEVRTLNTRPQSAQLRRPAMRRTSSRVVDLHQHHGIERLLELVEQRVERVGLREVARKPVEDEAAAASGSPSRSRIMPSTMSSATSVPAVHGRLRLQAELGAARNRLAQQVAGGDLRDAERSTRRWDCVPLPEPGAPSSTIRMFCSVTERGRAAATTAGHVTGGLRKVKLRRRGCRAPPRRMRYSSAPRKLHRCHAMKTARRPRNAFYAQSGGVTAVINASACGVIETARKHARTSARSTPAATASSARSPKT